MFISMTQIPSLSFVLTRYVTAGSADSCAGHCISSDTGEMARLCFSKNSADFTDVHGMADQRYGNVVQVSRDETQSSTP